MAGELTEYATIPTIGNRNRWLNIVAINDLDNDGFVEIAWIQTPHIGGILKVARIEAGEMEVIDEISQYSNHGIGERNMCLSVLTGDTNLKIFYVPNQNRNRIVGFIFSNNALIEVEEIVQPINFAETLMSQYAFSSINEEENNCIYIE